MSKKFLKGIDVANQPITSVGTGSAGTDAVNVAQLNAALIGVTNWHGAVRAASTANVTVSSPGAAIDGVTLANGDRVLLKNQTTGSENGVYVFNGASSAMTRPTDGVNGALLSGAAFYVDEGSTNADSAYTLTTDAPITVGTTSLTFAKFGGGGTTYTAGTGISASALAGGSIAVDTTVVARKYAANLGDGSSTAITLTHGLGTLDVVAQLVEVSTGATVDTDTTRPSTTTITFTFATAPTTSQYRAIVIG